MGEFGIGQAVPRFEDPRLVRGEGRYVGDIMLPGNGVRLCAALAARARARSVRSTPPRPRPRPACWRCSPGADWEASGFGDLPVPGGLKRRDGSPLYRPRYPALVKDRVRWVGDYVAFVVAETYHQAADAAELIEVDYEPLPAVVSTADAVEPGAPLRVRRLPEQHLLRPARRRQGGDRRGLRARRPRRQAPLRDQPRHRRQHGAARQRRRLPAGRRPLHASTPRLQRTFTFREELAKNVLKVPENKVRVIAGDIGGSFGMKSRGLQRGRAGAVGRQGRPAGR